jgi:hypothetical protein
VKTIRNPGRLDHGALRNTSWPAQAQLTALHVNETAAFSAAQDASEAG